jgi:hypothetical protein
MASIIKSVSLSFEEDDFIKKWNLSPTQLLREKIWEMKGMFKNTAEVKIAKMAVIIQEQASVIERLENVLEEKEAREGE